MSNGEKNFRDTDGTGQDDNARQIHPVSATESGSALTDPEKSGLSLVELMHARMDIPSPFMKEVFLLRQAIVGTRYLGGSDELVEDLKPGSRITFVAEPDNKFDKNAVMALDGQGRKLGYIPRHENGIIGALLKAGKSIYGIMPDEQPSQGAVAPGSERTPFSLWVDLYMKEFLLPDDMSQIPRQGYQGSYAVADFILWDDEEKQICSIFAIKVINGKERDTFWSEISRDDPEEYREAIAAFQKFVGYLPIVSHDITDEILPQLEDTYGVLLGVPFSNRVIDTLQMAANHIPWVRNASLGRLAKELGIEVHCDTKEEERCRMIWKLYIRMERSELEKKEDGGQDMDRRSRMDRGTSDYTGREICKALRAIRVKIAKENGISYFDDECTSKGPCKGTCPRCDAEIYYLNEELQKKQARGEEIVITDIGTEEIEKYRRKPFVSGGDDYPPSTGAAMEMGEPMPLYDGSLTED